MVKSKGTKLLVKNIPFEGTKSEIRELFSAFGQIKSVRMPTKFDGSHRGLVWSSHAAKKCIDTSIMLTYWPLTAHTHVQPD